jgi:hypothetical protein
MHSPPLLPIPNRKIHVCPKDAGAHLLIPNPEATQQGELNYFLKTF